MGYIYKITNKTNKKSYIGLTSKNVEERWREHIQASNNIKLQRPLYSAIRKYGLSNFDIEIIEEVEEDFLGEREIFWISHFNTYEEGYNATMGGDGKWTNSVEQYDLDGNVIGIYPNIAKAVSATNISESVLRGVCQKRYKSAKKFLFKYSGDKTTPQELVKSFKDNNYYKRGVSQYSLDGKLLSSWNSIKAAENETGISNIGRSINHSKPCSGYVWRSSDKDFFDGLDLTSIIVQLSLENEIIAYYDSFLSAAKSLGKNTGSAISEVCRNVDNHKTAYGFKWRYLKDV